MAVSINKRQQVRNERALHDLIKTVPGNDRCADCSTRNPGACGIVPCLKNPMLTVEQDGQAGV
jgi:hypothetical protein